MKSSSKVDALPSRSSNTSVSPILADVSVEDGHRASRSSNGSESMKDKDSVLTYLEPATPTSKNFYSEANNGSSRSSSSGKSGIRKKSSRKAAYYMAPREEHIYVYNEPEALFNNGVPAFYSVVEERPPNVYTDISPRETFYGVASEDTSETAQPIYNRASANLKDAVTYDTAAATPSAVTYDKAAATSPPVTYDTAAATSSAVTYDTAAATSPPVTYDTASSGAAGHAIYGTASGATRPPHDHASACKEVDFGVEPQYAEAHACIPLRRDSRNRRSVTSAVYDVASGMMVAVAAEEPIYHNSGKTEESQAREEGDEGQCVEEEEEEGEESLYDFATPGEALPVVPTAEPAYANKAAALSPPDRTESPPKHNDDAPLPGEYIQLA